MVTRRPPTAPVRTAIRRQPNQHGRMGGRGVPQRFSEQAHDPVPAWRDAVEARLRTASTGRKAAVDRILRHRMAEPSFNGRPRLAHAHRTTSRHEHVYDGPLDHPIAKPQRLGRLSPEPGARPRLGNPVGKRLQNARQA